MYELNKVQPICEFFITNGHQRKLLTGRKCLENSVAACYYRNLFKKESHVPHTTHKFKIHQRITLNLPSCGLYFPHCWDYRDTYNTYFQDMEVTKISLFNPINRWAPNQLLLYQPGQMLAIKAYWTIQRWAKPMFSQKDHPESPVLIAL